MQVWKSCGTNPRLGLCARLIPHRHSGVEWVIDPPFLPLVAVSHAGYDWCTMPEYRRAIVNGGTFFLIVGTGFLRRLSATDSARRILREAIRANVAQQAKLSEYDGASR